MTSISETIRHYQRSIDRSVKDEARLLHCLDKLNKLPITMKYLKETKVGRTVNNLRKHDGVVGHAATSLITKWKREVEAKNVEPSDKSVRMYTDDTENIEPAIQNKYSDSTSSTPNLSVSFSTDSSSSKSSCSVKSQKERSSHSGNWDEKMSKSHENSSSISGSSAKRESDSSLCSDYYRVKTTNSKRKECEKSNDKKRRRESDLIDIDSTMGTSFAEALGMLDVTSTSKSKKVPNDKSSLSSKRSTSSRHTSFDETPILLTKRPQLEPPLDIAMEILTPSTVTESKTLQCAFRQPQKQTTQLADEVTINIISRTSKTKVFSGNKAGLKCKVPTLFEMCIRILQDNVDLLEFIGGVPFDLLRPVLERTTCEQLMMLEDYNPYLMEDTHCLWEQHCKRRFRTKSREELETWRDMYIRCYDEEREKFNSLTAIIKVSKERLTKPAYVDTNTKAIKITKALSHAVGNKTSGCESVSQNATKSKDSNQIRKRSKKSNDDPDWTPTTWYKTLYKKQREPKPPKPPKPPIKKTIDMLRYDRAKELEKKKEEWERRRR